jgi:hypothetical protein
MSGMKYIVLHSGAGRPAADGTIWGIQWKLVSHSQRGCKYRCTTYVLDEKSDRRFKPWVELAGTMREGEVRRVWVTWPGERESKTYEVELASVVMTDAMGNPIIDNSYPPKSNEPVPRSST